MSATAPALMARADDRRHRLLDEPTAVPSPPPISAADEEQLNGWLRALHVLSLACRQQLRVQKSDGGGGGGGGGGGVGGDAATAASRAAATVAIAGASDQADQELAEAGGEVDEPAGGWSVEDSGEESDAAEGEAEEETLESYLGEVVAELLGGHEQAAAAEAALERDAQPPEAEPPAEAEGGGEDDEDPEAAVRRAEALELAANTPPSAGQLALALLSKAEVLLLSGDNSSRP